MIRQAKEGAISWFPELTARDIPHPLPAGIRIHIKNNEIGVEVQGLVGAIPLINGDTLQINPKIDRVNFFHLLWKAEGAQTDLEREYDAFVQYSLSPEVTIDTVVARQLIISAGEILRFSPTQGRVKCQREGSFARGRMNEMRTALNIASHKQEPVSYIIKERTLHTPENCIITEAIIRAWHLIDDHDRNRFRNIYEQWIKTFSRSENITDDLQFIENKFASKGYGGSRDYYRKPLMLSQIILGSNGLGYNDVAAIEGDAILLNTADIYEKYLRNVIRSSYSTSGYIVNKGGIGITSLYMDGSFELQPDIVISRNGKTVLILDAKYKYPTAGDHYQMNVYLRQYGVACGILLAPSFTDDQIRIKEYSTSDMTVVYEVFLPMSKLTVTEQFLASVIEHFPPRSSPRVPD